ncbi:MAG: TonB-dependent receptor, partial [Gammaproteobacteria bacterium]
MKQSHLSAAILALLSTASFADEVTNNDIATLEPIIVDSDFRPMDSQEIPISITTISAEEMQVRSAQHLDEVLNLAPNVNFSSGSSRGKYFQIRGIGERSQFQAPLNPSVGLYIDDIDFSRSAGAATLFDIDRVDIFRGPQGTRFGANGLAGVIALHSKEATNDLDVHFESTLADYDTRSIGLAVGGALVDNKLFGRMALYTNKSDGYIENEYLDRDNTNNIDETTLRTHLKWLATDNLTLSLNYLHLDIDNGYDAFSFNNDRHTFSDQPGTDSQNTDAFALRADWDVSSALRIEGVITHSNSDLEYSYDEDWSYVGQFDPSLFPYSSFDQYLRDRDNNSIEIRALSNEDGRIFNDTTAWLVGFYHATQDEDLKRNYTYLAEQFTSQYDTENTAIFGQFDSALTHKLSLISGLRIEYWESDYEDSNDLDSGDSDTLYGGKLGLNYQFNQAQMSYTSLSRGYKAGGVNTDGTLPDNALNFDTEYLWNLEAGLKSLWLGGSMRTNLSVFYAERKDQQVQSSLLNTRPDGSTEFIPYITNAAEGRNMGLEADIDWLVTQDWRVFANVGLLRATFEEYIDPDGIDADGRDQAHAPRYQFSLGADYYLGQHWTFHANVEGKDEFYFSDRHNAKSDSYALVNASVE